MRILKSVLLAIFRVIYFLADISEILGLVVAGALMLPLIILPMKIPDGHPFLLGFALVAYFGFIVCLFVAYVKFANKTKSEPD